MMPWTSTFEDAEERLLDLALAATPQQRLDWLEEAQQFALESGIRVDHDLEPPSANRGEARPVTGSKPGNAPEPLPTRWKNRDG